MQSLTFKIVKSKKSTTILVAIGLILTSCGILFSFILDSEIEYRPHYIGTPLIVGLLILLILKVVYPIEDIGQLKIKSDGIEIQKANSNWNLTYYDIENIRLIINGYEMELNRNWWILSREFFPFEQGHNNEIIITDKKNHKVNCRFFLKNKKYESRLIESLNNASKTHNFDLNI